MCVCVCAMYDEVYPNIYYIYIYIYIINVLLCLFSPLWKYLCAPYFKKEEEEVIKHFESLKAFNKLAVIITMMIY